MCSGRSGGLWESSGPRMPGTAGNMDGNVGGSVSPLAFENGQVMLRTAKGLAPVQVEKTPFLGGLLPPAASLSAAAADAGKTTLRLGAESLACRLSSPARQRLLESLQEWESRRNAQAASLQQRASKYRAAVERYAARFKLQPELVYAIIYTESSFDPGMISSQNAHGLMQVVPQTAGGEVNSWLGNASSPSTAELLEPDTNIKYGTAYLHLLLTRHLNAIENPRSREYCAIAAYNIGSGGMLRVFGQTRESAFETINVLTPEGVRDKLLQSLPSRETRAFLEKVLAARGYFVARS